MITPDKYTKLYFIAISLSLADSNGPVLSTIDRNTDWCFCSKLIGVSNSITLPDDKTYMRN